MKKARYSIKLPCKVGDLIEYTGSSKSGSSKFRFVVDKIIIDRDEIRILKEGNNCVVYAREFAEYCKIIEKNAEIENGRPCK